MPELTMQNGQVVDADDPEHICYACQQPGADVRALTGEWYHSDCLPDDLTG